MATIANLLIKIAADVKGALPELDKLPAKLTDIGGKMDSIGKKMTVGLSLPLAALGLAAAKMSTDFNGAMANVATLIPDSTARVLELKDAVQEMAIATGKGTADLADGAYEVISAFGDTADTVKILETNAKAAAAGLATTKDAISLTSGVTKAYGEAGATAVSKVADLAFQAVNLGQTTFPELAASIGRVTPLTAAMGVSMEDLFGAMATFTGVTGGAAEVSTQLRGIMQALMAPTDATRALMDKMGFTTGQAMVKQLGLQGSIQALVKASESSGQPLQEFIGSIEGQTLALAATGGQAATFTQRLKDMESAVGATNTAFKEQTQGINKAGFAWAQLQQKLAVTAQRLGDELAPVVLDTMEALKPMIDGVLGLVRAFGQLDPTAKRIVIGVVALVAAIGPVLVGLGSLVTAVGTLMPVLATVGAAIASMAAVAIPALGVAFAALMGPLGIAVAAVLAFPAAFLIIKNWKTLVPWFQGMWSQFVALTAPAANGLIGAFETMANAVIGALQKAVNWAIGPFFNVFNLFPKEAQKAFNGLMSATVKIPRVTVPAIKQTTEAVKTLAGQANKAAAAMGTMGNTNSASTPGVIAPNLGDLGGGTGESPAEKIKKTLEELPGKMKAITALAGAFGSSFDANSERVSALRAAITALVENGLDPKSAALKKLITDLGGYQSAISSASKAAEKAKALETMLAEGMAAGPKILNDLDANLKAISASATLFGDKTGGAAQQQERIKGAIDALIPLYGANHAIVGDLKQQYDDLGKATATTSTGFEALTKSASDVLNAVGGLRDGLSTIAKTLGVDVADGFLGAVSSAGNLGLAVIQVATSFATLAPLVATAAGAVIAGFVPTMLALQGSVFGAIAGLGGLSITMLGGVVPAMQAATGAVIEFGVSLWTALAPILPILLAIAAVVAIVAVVGVAMYKSGEDARQMAAAMDGLKKSMADISAQAYVLGDAFDRDAATTKAYEDTLIELAKAGKQNTKEFAELSAKYEALKKKTRDLKDAQEALARSFAMTGRAISQMLDLDVVFTDFFNKLAYGEGFDKVLVSKTEIAKKALDDLVKTGREMGINDELGQQIKNAAAQWKEYQKQAAIAGTITGGVDSALKGAIKGFLNGTASLARGLKDGIKEAILDAITEAAMQGAIVKGAFGNLLESLTTGLANGSDVSGIIAQIGQQIPQVAQQLAGALAPLRGAIKGFGRAPAMAAGGIVTGPTMALVGEGSSDEAVLPLNDSTFQRMGAAIASAMPQRSAQATAGNTTIHITINAGASVVDDSSLERFARMIAIKQNQLRGFAT